MKRYINAYIDKYLLNTLYRYLLNAYIDKYPYKRLNTYIDKYLYRHLLNANINVFNEEVYKCLYR